MTAGPTTQSVKSSALIERRYKKACRLHPSRYAADTAASTERKYLGLGSLTEIHYDFSRVAGLGEFDRFLELLKWKAMGDDR